MSDTEYDDGKDSEWACQRRPGADRPTSEPGGCECWVCGCIFIGAEWHTRCAYCDRDAAEGGDPNGAPVPKDPQARA